MIGAIVLINVEVGSEAEVLKYLKKVEGVEEVFAVYGAYDIVARVKAAPALGPPTRCASVF